MDLVFERTTKMYGAVVGLNDLSVSIAPGVTGLLGSNGAGKSTFIKLASGQLRPTLGSVKVGDNDAWSSRAKLALGYCPDVDSFWESMTGRQFVRTLAGLHGFPRKEVHERTEESLAFVGMTGRADRRLGACSRGMRQRIKLAQALVHDPQIILLDEPMTGVDPGGRRELNELLRRLAERGKTIIMSTHLLREVEVLADGILMIARGRLVAQGPIAEIRRYLANQPMTLEVEAEPLRLAASKLAADPAVESVRVERSRLLIRTQNVERVLQLVQDMAVDDSLEVARLGVLDAGAEAVFSYLDRGAP